MASQLTSLAVETRRKVATFDFSSFLPPYTWQPKGVKRSRATRNSDFDVTFDTLPNPNKPAGDEDGDNDEDDEDEDQDEDEEDQDEDEEDRDEDEVEVEKSIKHLREEVSKLQTIRGQGVDYTWTRTYGDDTIDTPPLPEEGAPGDLRIHVPSRKAPQVWVLEEVVASNGSHHKLAWITAKQRHPHPRLITHVLSFRDQESPTWVTHSTITSYKSKGKAAERSKGPTKKSRGARSSSAPPEGGMAAKGSRSSKRMRRV